MTDDSLTRDEISDDAAWLAGIRAAYIRAWTPESAPSIETFLQGRNPAVQARVFRELLDADLECRRQAGLSWDSAKYHSKYSQWSHVIQEVLGELPTGPVPQADAAPSTLSLRNVTPADTVSYVESAESPVAAALIGEQIGDYELLEELARGGMGIVYKARQRSLNRIVALKLILSGQLADEEQVRRFHNEAEAAARLDHPHIVPVFEVGNDRGRHFFSMALIAGESLARRISAAELPPREAAVCLQKIASAIQYAHENGIVHRDLKPGNILIDHLGDPRITDFGLAKRADIDSDLTATGQILGTPNYMAPEQAAGRSIIVGPAADIYALGGVLYSMLTGRPPFRAATALEVVKQLLEQEPVPPRRLNASVDEDLNTICLKCLEKPPSRRYASAADVAADLGRYLRGDAILARPIGPLRRAARWCARRPLIASLGATSILLAVGLLVGSVVVAARLAADKQQLSESRTTIAAQERQNHQQLLQSRTSNMGAALAEGDIYGALVWTSAVAAAETERALRTGEDRGRELEILQRRFAALNRASPQLIQVFVHAQAARHVRFFPDGQRLAVASGKTAQIWDLATGQPGSPPLEHAGEIRDLRLAAGGRYLCTTDDEQHLTVWNTAEPGEPRFQRTFEHDVADLALSPDEAYLYAAVGDELSVIRGELSADRPSRVVRFRLEDGLQETIVESDREALVRVALSPDGTLLATATKTPDSARVQVWRAEAWSDQHANKSTGPVRGHAVSPPFQHQSTQEGYPHSGEIRDLAFRPDGKILLTNAQPGNREMMLSVRPGGLRDSAPMGQAQLWNPLTGRPVGKLMVHVRQITRAAFSPDSKAVLTADQDGGISLWDAETAERMGAPVSLDGSISHAEFSPCGRYFLTLQRDSVARIWSRDELSSAEPAFHVGTFASDAAFSRDGRLLALAVNDGTVRVWDLVHQHRVPVTFKHPGNIIFDAVFTRDNARLITAGGLEAYSWELAGQHASPSLWGDDHQMSYVRGSDDGQFLLAIESRRVAAAEQPQGNSEEIRRATALLYATSQPPAPPRELSVSGPIAAAFARQGKWVAVGTRRGKVAVFDTTSGRAVGPELEHGDGEIWLLATSADERVLVAVASDDSPRYGKARRATLRAWESREWSLLPGKLDVAVGVQAVDVNRDGTRVALALDRDDSGRGAARVYELPSWRLICEVPHNGSVQDVRFSPDGTLFATASGDSTARVWETATGQPRSRAMLHGDWVNSVRFSPDGSLLATACGAATATPGYGQVWEAETGHPVTPQFPHRGSVRDCRFSHDGRWLVTMGTDWAARLWNLAPEPISDARMVPLAQVSAGRKLDRTEGLVALTPQEFLDAWQEVSGQSGPSNDSSLSFKWHEETADFAVDIRDWFAVAHHLQYVLEAQPDGNLFETRGVANANLGRFPQAREDFLRAVELGRDSPKLHFNLGQTAWEMGEWEEAIRELSVALDHDPDLARARKLRGESYAELQQWLEASRDFEALTQQETGDIMALAKTALLHVLAARSSEYQELSRDLASYADKIDDPEVANVLAWTCLLHAGNLEDYGPLLALARRAQGATDFEWSPRLTLALALIRGREPAQAVQLLAGQTADTYATRGEYGIAEALRALALQQADRRDEAEQVLEQLRAGEPSSPSQDAAKDTWALRAWLQLILAEAQSPVAP